MKKDLVEEIGDMRQMLIDKIEGMTGSLTTIEWHKVSFEDMMKLYVALVRK